MHFRFSPKITLICLVLALGMVRASFWQWEKHLEKLEYIENLESRLLADITDFSTLFLDQPVHWNEFIHRRVRISGTFDFEHEMILRNRKHEDQPGVHVLTPLKIDGYDDKYVLVDRGFLPFHVRMPQERKAFQPPQHLEFVGLVKESVSRRFLAPADPPSGKDHPWVDAWLRPDLPRMQQQLPYDIFPVFLEIMSNTDSALAKESIISTDAGREELFTLQPHKSVALPTLDSSKSYPIPAFNTVVPAGRHFGYVFEWGIMAFVTLLIGFLLQIRKNAGVVASREAEKLSSHV